MSNLQERTVGGRQKIVISSLFFYKEDLAGKFVERLRGQMAAASSAGGLDVRLVLTLNSPFDSGIWDGIRREFAPFAGDGVELEVIERGFNLGFGASHNLVFQQVPSDVFIVMNNDLFCERDDWISAIARRLGDQGDCDLVGTDETLTDLRASDGCGIPPADRSNADFVDGSLLGVRSSLVERLGLFSGDYHYFYFEDSDMVLRYRQAGARVGSVPVPHTHLRWSGSQQLPRYLVKNILDINRGMFFSKWARYFDSRKFTGRCRADLSALSSVGAVESIPALLAFHRSHPGAAIDVVLPNGVQAGLFWHKSWRIVAPEESAPVDYDRVWIARPIQPQGELPPVLAYVRDVGGAFPEEATREYMFSTLEKMGMGTVGVERPRMSAVIVAPGADRWLNGVVPDPEFYLPAAHLLGSMGYETTWAIGDGAESFALPAGNRRVAPGIDELLRRIGTADLVVAPVGLGLSLAQLFGRKTFAPMGAVLADRSVWNWKTTGTFSAVGMDCLGCQHVWGREGRSYCIRRDEACISSDLGEVFAESLANFLRYGQSTDDWSRTASQRLGLLRRRESTELDLSRWSDE